MKETLSKFKPSTIDTLDSSFVAMAHANALRCKYGKLLEATPVGQWVRCADIAKKMDTTIQAVSCLFNNLVANKLAQKRTVDDGVVSYTTWEYAPVEVDPSIPKSIAAYDQDGNFLGIFPNPKYTNRRNSEMEYREVKKYVKASHSEFYVLPF